MKVNCSAYAHNLSLINWQLFGTLTFRDLAPTNRLWACAWLHFQRMARQTCTPYGKLLICLRYELGEHGERPHFHYLMGGTPWRNHRALAHACQAEWRSRTGSIVEVRPYDRDQSGAGYVVKCLGANEYERRKFDTANQVEVSDSVLALMKRIRIGVHAQDARIAQDGNGQVANLDTGGDSFGPLPGVKDGCSPLVA